MTAGETPRRARARTAVDLGRQVAYDALRLVVTDDAYLNLALVRLRAEREVTGRDAAFATELAAGTARMQGLYDDVLGQCVRGGLEPLQADVLVALRMGAHQLLSMRVPDHAAVGTTVELVRAAVGERPVRLANAVLRAVGRHDLEVWVRICAPQREHDLLGHLATRYSHPRWIVEELAIAVTDTAALEALLAADNQPPVVTLAVRPGLASRASLVAEGVVPGRWSPYAATMPGGGDPAALAAVRRGTVGVQDEGSQLVALVLANAVVEGRDMRWLDLCAGPGGKAALLTGLARHRGATLVGSDRQPHRARLVRSALRAYGPLGTVVCADAMRPAWQEGAFDRVIADVPCSGLGALRRRPESRWRRTPRDVETLVPLQRALLGSALDAVRPGGVVAYVTCSPVRAETRGVVEEVLARRCDAREEDARVLLPDVPDLGAGPHLQLWPHLHGTDAMFCALLRRTG
ncbi:MAG: RsmB/NOP family class I SAM-dependent RNA methyltransferase [Nocardioidaceae bacterium]|nr:RsmB/NOP family class I SAM-dependent RNA methyltransferase [Nocardioidaceae bacterium]